MPDPKYYGESAVATANAETFDRYADNEAVYTALIESKKAGSNSIALPEGHDSTDADKKLAARIEVAHKMGAPKTAADMDFGEVELAGNWNDDGVKLMKDICTKFGLHTDQAKGIFNEFLASEKLSDAAKAKAKEEADKATKEATDKLEADLKTDWGDDLDDNIKGCEKLVQKYGSEDVLKSFKDLPIAVKTDMMRMLNKLQRDFIQEGKLPGGAHLGAPLKAPLLDYSKTG